MCKGKRRARGNSLCVCLVGRSAVAANLGHGGSTASSAQPLGGDGRLREANMLWAVLLLWFTVSVFNNSDKLDGGSEDLGRGGFREKEKEGEQEQELHL